jgi:hypothetical protein
MGHEPQEGRGPAALWRRLLGAHRGRSLADWGILAGIYFGALTVLIGFLTLWTGTGSAPHAEEGAGPAPSPEDFRESAGSEAADGPGEPTGNQRPSPGLELAQVLASIDGGIPGTVVNDFDPEDPKPEEREFYGVSVDISLRNVGDLPAFVSEVTLRFLKSGYLEHCFAEGGWLDFTVDYHFPIPSDQPYESGDWREHTVPFELSSQVSHVVPPREYEKLRVTVGPEWASEGMNTWYGVFEAVLEHDDGQLLETGPIAALGPFAYTSLRHAEDGGTGDIPGCMDRIVAVAGEAFNAPELVRSREVAELSEFLGLD